MTHFLIMVYLFAKFDAMQCASASFKLMLIVDLLFNVHGKHLRLCRDGQLT